MSLEQINAVVENFISDTHNELLVIKGKWGVGKTFFWQNLIKECNRKKSIGRDYYSYISLFGINSLEELNNSILASRVDSNPNKIQQTLDTLTANLRNLASGLEKVPAIREYTGGMISAFLHLLIDNTLICFDDLERRGDGLAIKDIFGLASLLKEQRGCKVVLIMNEEGLDEDAQKQFKLHGEKIIDREILFSITIEEAFSYIFPPSFRQYDLIKECCFLLHVKNIRTLQRIKRFIEDITPHLKGIEETVAESALRSLILFVWSYYEQGAGAPSLEFVLKYSPVSNYLAKQNKKELSPEEKKWNEVLGAYNYFRTDDVDKCLAEFVETGYIDKPKLSQELDKENKQFRVQQGQNSLSKPWEIYRSSFDDNEQEFIETLVNNCRSNIKVTSPSNLDSVVTALREFERDNLANALVDEYFNQHNSEEEITAIRLSKGTIFVSDIKDEYLLSKLNNIWTSNEFDKRSLAEVVRALTFKVGWNEEDIRHLDSFTTDDYYNFFKTEKSADLYHYVQKCLEFGKFEGGTEMYRSIGEKAKEALLKIASESRINRKRVSALYNIEVI
jgi:hypothetical protein